MGLIDFVKSAGRKVGLGEEEQAAQPPSGGPSPEEIERLRVRKLAAGIVKTIEDLGFEVQELGVRVDGDVATVSGSVASQELREKVVLLVGNTAGIARVDDRLEVESPEPEAQMYTVQSGDTLSAIAQQFYGDAGKYPVIFEANRPMLEDPDRIYPGQVLRIPPAG